MPSPEAPLPTFLIIGAQKSATRWLRHNLGLHPEVYTAPREVEFFNYNRRFNDLGLDWYRSQLEGWMGEPIVGEATPGYMMLRHRPKLVARRIESTLPDVRLIAILRNPIDRAQSALVHHVLRGRVPEGSSVLDLARATPPEHERLSLVEGGLYAASLAPFRQRFEERLLVLLHDDVCDDPGAVYARVLRHIGATPNFVPADLDQIVFSNEERKPPIRDLTEEDRRELYGFFRDDLRRLRRMLRWDLSMWNPEARSRKEPLPLTPSDLQEYFERACGWVAGVVDRAALESHEQRAGSARRTVDEIVHELIGGLRFLTVVLQREALPAGPHTIEYDDPGVAYREAVDALRSAITDATNLEGTIATERGEAPAPRLALAGLTEQLISGRELASATGQDVTLPRDLAEIARTSARRIAMSHPATPERYRAFVEGTRAA